MKNIAITSSILIMFFFTTLAVAANDIDLRQNEYKSSLLPLGTGYQARLYCSCIFVMKRDEVYCKKFVEVSPKIFKTIINNEEKSVEAKALYFFSKSKARWHDSQTGCVLE
ncbi:MAG: hypothetical protein ACK5P5_09815 [Pseudobdellovibrionaceae bacterium]